VPKAVLFWSGGKDSAWALQQVRDTADIIALITTVSAASGRSAVHSIPVFSLEAQARSAGLPLWTVPIPDPCPNLRYEQAMAEVVRRAVAAGAGSAIFGDLHLRDIREYRERLFAGTGLEPLFPLWGASTTHLALEMIDAGLRARIVSVNLNFLTREFAGREFDRDLLRDLPQHIDACGENGEFHTFAYSGPMFDAPVPANVEGFREQGGFVYAELTGCPVSSH
jgi:uncharacterized protein (TIGR00290 family)